MTLECFPTEDNSQICALWKLPPLDNALRAAHSYLVGHQHLDTSNTPTLQHSNTLIRWSTWIPPNTFAHLCFVKTWQLLYRSLTGYCATTSLFATKEEVQKYFAVRGAKKATTYRRGALSPAAISPCFLPANPPLHYLIWGTQWYVGEEDHLLLYLAIFARKRDLC